MKLRLVHRAITALLVMLTVLVPIAVLERVGGRGHRRGAPSTSPVRSRWDTRDRPIPCRPVPTRATRTGCP